MSSEPRRAIQLYSVRSLEESLPEIIHQVADAGYEGVEFAHRFREESPAEVAAALDATGLDPVGVHASLSLLEAALDGENDLIGRCNQIGCDRVIVPHLSARRFRTQSSIDATVRQLQDVASALADHDLRLGVHVVRHYMWPLLPNAVDPLINRTPLPSLAGQYAGMVANRMSRAERIPENTGIWNLFKQTDPDELFFELEVAEVRAAGYDPVASIECFGERVEMIHLRDVGRTGRLGSFRNVPHGEGLVEMGPVVEAAQASGIAWIVYENELEGPHESKIADGSALFERLKVPPGEEHS